MAIGRLLVVPLTVAAVALGACGGSDARPAPESAATVPAKAPQLLTARHNEKTFRLARGRSIELRLAHGAEIDSTGTGGVARSDRLLRRSGLPRVGAERRGGGGVRS